MMAACPYRIDGKCNRGCRGFQCRHREECAPSATQSVSPRVDLSAIPTEALQAELRRRGDKLVPIRVVENLAVPAGEAYLFDGKSMKGAVRLISKPEGPQG